MLRNILTNLKKLRLRREANDLDQGSDPLQSRLPRDMFRAEYGLQLVAPQTPEDVPDIILR